MLAIPSLHFQGALAILMIWLAGHYDSFLTPAHRIGAQCQAGVPDLQCQARNNLILRHGVERGLLQGLTSAELSAC